MAYALTAKGEALRPILLAMKNWGLAWEKHTRAMKIKGTVPYFVLQLAGQCAQ
jgi:DNA-binding HxlR family transcriptional regulator